MFPKKLSDPFVAVGVQGIITLVVFTIGIANDKQCDGRIGVVDKRVRDARAGGKAYAVAGCQIKETTIDPHLWFALNHVDEFLFRSLSVGPRSSAARRQGLMMNSDSLEPKALA